MKESGITLRFARKKDTALILELIRGLADYEHLLHLVEADEAKLKHFIFREKKAEVVIAECGTTPAGFALFFHNFSTFLGRPGIYIEDLFVKPEFRGKGAGKMLLSFLARLALKRECGRLEWSCLDWNEPSIQFYKSRGARAMDEWTVYRVDGAELTALANDA